MFQRKGNFYFHFKFFFSYERDWRQSPQAIKVLEWLETKHNLKIIHAGNGKEKCYFVNGERFFLDGYNAENHIAYEVLGCYIHGCPRCFGARPGMQMINGKSAVECFEEQCRRKKLLETIENGAGKKMKVVELWDCEIKKMLEKEEIITADGKRITMKEFFSDRPEKGRIDPRAAYSGGRTGKFVESLLFTNLGPCNLYAKADEHFEISMADIVSLYPYVFQNFILVIIF